MEYKRGRMIKELKRAPTHAYEIRGERVREGDRQTQQANKLKNKLAKQNKW